MRLAEAVTSATPYLTRRLKLLQEYDSSAEVNQFRHEIMAAYKSQKAETRNAAEMDVANNAGRTDGSESDNINGRSKSPETELQTPPNANAIHFNCPGCQKQIFVPTEGLDGKIAIAVKCPNPECQKISRVSNSSSNSKTQPEKKTGKRELSEDFDEKLSQM